MLILPDFNIIAKKILDIYPKKWHTFNIISFFISRVSYLPSLQVRPPKIKHQLQGSRPLPLRRKNSWKEAASREPPRHHQATGRAVTSPRIAWFFAKCSSILHIPLGFHPMEVTEKMNFEWCIYKIDFSLGWNLYETSGISQAVILGVSTLCTPCPSASTWATGGNCLEWPLNTWRP